MYNGSLYNTKIIDKEDCWVRLQISVNFKNSYVPELNVALVLFWGMTYI